MPYFFKIEGTKIFAAPIQYDCLECNFSTDDFNEMQHHEQLRNHPIDTVPQTDRSMEYDESVHGPLPDFIQKQLSGDIETTL